MTNTPRIRTGATGNNAMEPRSLVMNGYYGLVHENPHGLKCSAWSWAANAHASMDVRCHDGCAVAFPGWEVSVVHRFASLDTAMLRVPACETVMCVWGRRGHLHFARAVSFEAQWVSPPLFQLGQFIPSLDEGLRQRCVSLSPCRASQEPRAAQSAKSER